MKDFEKFREKLWKEESKNSSHSKFKHNFFIYSLDLNLLELYYELNKYFDSVLVEKLSKKGVSREEVELVILELMKTLIVIPKAIYYDKFHEAYEISRSFDPKDTPFIALSLKLNVPIWTNDKKLIEFSLRTGKYIALDTRVVEDPIKGKSLKDVLEELKRRTL